MIYKNHKQMKKVIYVVLAVMMMGTVLQACSSKLCPAYNSYPEARTRR
jgi:hypothetical protein